MPLIDGCCCFERLHNGSKASAVYTFVTGVINIIIDIWMLVSLHWMNDNLEANEKIIWLPPGILAFLYFELLFNFIRLVLAFCLYVGVNQRYEGRNLVRAWKLGMMWFRFYQFFLMVYSMVWIGGHRITDVVYVVPESILIAVYWLLDCIIYIAAHICVISYMDELIDEIFGKERRVKYFTKLANIRGVAQARLGTPSVRSYYASRNLGMSQQSLGQSQPFIGMGHPQMAGSQQMGQPQMARSQQSIGQPYRGRSQQSSVSGPGGPSMGRSQQFMGVPPQMSRSQQSVGGRPQGYIPPKA